MSTPPYTKEHDKAKYTKQRKDAEAEYKKTGKKSDVYRSLEKKGYEKPDTIGTVKAKTSEKHGTTTLEDYDAAHPNIIRDSINKAGDVAKTILNTTEGTKGMGAATKAAGGLMGRAAGALKGTLGKWGAGAARTGEEAAEKAAPKAAEAAAPKAQPSVKKPAAETVAPKIEKAATQTPPKSAAPKEGGSAFTLPKGNTTAKTAPAVPKAEAPKAAPASGEMSEAAQKFRSMKSGTPGRSDHWKGMSKAEQDAYKAEKGTTSKPPKGESGPGKRGRPKKNVAPAEAAAPKPASGDEKIDAAFHKGDISDLSYPDEVGKFKAKYMTKDDKGRYVHAEGFGKGGAAPSEPSPQSEGSVDVAPKKTKGPLSQAIAAKTKAKKAAAAAQPVADPATEATNFPE